MADSSEIVFILGTRPEIIKTAPILREVQNSNQIDSHIVHTDQHYDHNMSSTFFESLNIQSPDEHLGVGSGTHAEQTANALVQIEEILMNREPEAVLAQGDTNAVLSTAIAASKLPVDFCHIEAGIRSFDRSMPEEMNRILADKAADICFAPTIHAVENLEGEGVVDEVYETGNTIVDACLEHRLIAESESEILEQLGLRQGNYAVTTIHRARNTNNRERLSAILNRLDSQEFPVVFPCHPRTQDAITGTDFNPSDSLTIIDPLDYLDFIKLLANARLAVTDSGGIQEEASILEVPCLTVRPNTERPETVSAGVNRLIEPEELGDTMEKLFVDDNIHDDMQGARSLYGDGNSGKQIVRILENHYT